MCVQDLTEGMLLEQLQRRLRTVCAVATAVYVSMSKALEDAAWAVFQNGCTKLFDVG